MGCVERQMAVVFYHGWASELILGSITYWFGHSAGELVGIAPVPITHWHGHTFVEREFE